MTVVTTCFFEIVFAY